MPLNNGEKKELSWAYITLREFFERMCAERHKGVDALFLTHQRALELAKGEVDHRLAGMNEFQKRIDRLEGTLATKDALAKIEKLVWIGLGIVLTLNVVAHIFVLHFLVK